MMIATDMHVLASDYTGDYFYEPSSIFDGKLTHYSNEYFDAFLAEVMAEMDKLTVPMLTAHSLKKKLNCLRRLSRKSILPTLQAS